MISEPSGRLSHMDERGAVGWLPCSVADVLSGTIWRGGVEGSIGKGRADRADVLGAGWAMDGIDTLVRLGAGRNPTGSNELLARSGCAGGAYAGSGIAALDGTPPAMAAVAVVAVGWLATHGSVGAIGYLARPATAAVDPPPPGAGDLSNDP